MYNMSQTPAFQRGDGQNNIVIVPTVSFSKNVPTPPLVHIQKKDALKVQSGQQNMLGELTDTASIMSQPKSTALIEEQADVMCSIEYQLEQLMPTSLEHQTKPSQTSSNADVNKNFANVDNFNKTKKVNSWASSYLQSIGHDYLKPVKINLSLSKNGNKTAKTISTKSNKSNETVAQPTFLKGTTSSFGGINMTQSPPEFIKPDEQTISEHKYNGNIETLHPANVNVCRSQTNEQSEVHSKIILPMCQKITSTSVTSNIMLDTLYSNNNINKAPAYASLLAKGIGEATYCYNDEKREIDIYDAIKSKIKNEIAIEQKQHSMMNLPTHKKMCEDFIKEISNNNASKSDRKKQSTTNTETKLKNLVKKDKKQLNKQSSKETKKQTSDKERVQNTISSLKIDKSEKKEKKLDKECQLKEKQQKIKPIIDMKDFGSISKHIFDKETETEQKSPSVDRLKLKRVRAISEDLHNASSGIRTHTPIRSVVHVTENCQNKPKRQCLDENFDLRSKLSRVNERIYKKTHMQRDSQSMNKIPKSRENLKITVEHQTNEKQKSPKKFGVLKKSKKCKKLKLIINVVCPGSDDETTSSDSSYSETENNPTHNMDLSFLDDFNVDEIVDCLKHSPKHKIKSPLPSDNKMEDNTKIPCEPELKLSTILNMLSAKSTETDKFKNPAKTDFTTEETIKNTSSTRSNDLNNPSLATDVKTSSLKSEENANNKKNLTTHALVLLTETKLQVDQKKTASWEEGYLNAKCGIKAEDVTNKTQKHKQANEENEKITIDESVLIVDPGISIIDLTDENVVDASATNDITVFAKPNQSEKPNNENKKPKVKSVEFNSIENNLKPAPNTHRNTNKEKSKSETINGQQMDVDADLKIPILDKNEEIFINLTHVDDEIKSNHSINTSLALVDVKCKLVTETPSENKLGKQTDDGTETDSANEIIKQPDIHLIPLPNKNAVTSTENKKTVETKTLKDTDNYTNGNYKNTDESKSKVIENASPTYKRNGDSKTKEIICTNNLNKKIFETNGEIRHNETNTKIMNQEKPIQSLKKNKMSLGYRATKDNASNANKKMSKVFETKLAKTLIKNIVESIWGGSKDNPENTKTNNGAKTKPENAPKTNEGEKFETENKCNNETQNESENTSTAENNNGIKNEPETIPKINISVRKETENIPKTIKGTKNEDENSSITTNVTTNEIENTKTNNDNNTTENKSKINNGCKNKPENNKTNNGTNNESGNTSKSNDSVANKLRNDSNLTVEKPLAVYLKKRMKEYLHKDMKIIRLIHLGKYSKIFSCKDTNGRTYAAKVTLEHEKKHCLVGKKKEQMIRMIQQDIPKENLNTVQLIDGFGVEKNWCFLMEYYPKTLKQVLSAQINMKPFHIDLVQHLARQLISAVLVLRNNGIVHSDIKPAHILMNPNQNRIKLCGFDAAYFPNNKCLVPNIGTAKYRAPEIILGFSAGFSIDVWSSALVIHEMATNQTLFTGVYNNDILFKQMCTFGYLPMDMIEASSYKTNHFTGRIFKRRVGVRGEGTLLYNKFHKTKRLQMSIMVAYDNHWATNDVYQRDTDMFKLGALHRLLEQMLLLDPRWRLAIEFVCADPFIYEMFA